MHVSRALVFVPAGVVSLVFLLAQMASTHPGDPASASDESRLAPRLAQSEPTAAELEALLEWVPADADIVATSPEVGASGLLMRQMLLTEELIDEMLGELHDYLRWETGFSISNVAAVVVWAEGDSNSWGAVVVAQVEGELRTDRLVETGGNVTLRLGDDIHLATADDLLLVGGEEGMSSMFEAQRGARTSLARSGSALAALVQMGFEESTLSVAAGPEILRRLGPAELGLQAASVEFHESQLSVRVRTADAEVASQIQTMLLAGRAAMLDRLDDMLDGLMLEEFPLPAIAIFQRHFAHGLLESQLELTVEGADVRADLTVPSLDPETVALVGVMAAIAVPAFLRYIRRSKTVEAALKVRRLFDAAVTYYQQPHTDATGERLPAQFPASAPLTPAAVPCGEPVPPEPSQWDTPTWQALNFAIYDPHRYSYQFDSVGVGESATFTASAFGDLDCDGVFSTFVRVGTGMPAGEVRGGAGLYMANELE
jgi:type IV pilus assembly protein PilA